MRLTPILALYTLLTACATDPPPSPPTFVIDADAPLPQARERCTHYDVHNKCLDGGATRTVPNVPDRPATYLLQTGGYRRVCRLTPYYDGYGNVFYTRTYGWTYATAGSSGRSECDVVTGSGWSIAVGVFFSGGPYYRPPYGFHFRF